MGKVDENKKKKKEALFNTAYELFTTKGINATAISDIVEKAGVAKGTFYLYFKDKYDIKNKLTAFKTHELFEKAAKALRKADISGLEEQLIFFIDYIIDALASAVLAVRLDGQRHIILFQIGHKRLDGPNQIFMKNFSISLMKILTNTNVRTLCYSPS